MTRASSASRGVQPKTALLFENGRWGVPSGRIPTTHILKPTVGRVRRDSRRERAFLPGAAHALWGFLLSIPRIMRFGDEVAIVVERYDRIRTRRRLCGGVHQEDICQALGIPPTRQILQNEGGPGIRDIVELLRTYSGSAAEDVRTFLDSKLPSTG